MDKGVEVWLENSVKTLQKHVIDGNGTPSLILRMTDVERRTTNIDQHLSHQDEEMRRHSEKMEAGLKEAALHTQQLADKTDLGFKAAATCTQELADKVESGFSSSEAKLQVLSDKVTKIVVVGAILLMLLQTCIELFGGAIVKNVFHSELPVLYSTLAMAKLEQTADTE